MLNISAEQLAELLIGIARAQTAVIHGVDNAMAGIRTQNIVPALQNAAHLRDHPEPTLIDLPVRILLTSQGRVPPDAAVVARDLERLLSGTAAAAPAPAADGAGAARSVPGPSGGAELDFTAPGT